MILNPDFLCTSCGSPVVMGPLKDDRPGAAQAETPVRCSSPTCPNGHVGPKLTMIWFQRTT